jgi:catechol 2,3-dioxygenase-like lactoylglutathione lyase family enzyme
MDARKRLRTPDPPYALAPNIASIGVTSAGRIERARQRTDCVRPEPNRPARRRSHGKPGTDPTLPRAILTAAEPQLFVADIKASCDFFTQKLGFALAFVYGDPPFYGQVKRDAAALNLRCVDRPVIDAELREREHLLSAAVTVATSAEIEQLYAEFQGAGVAFHQALERQPWGAKNFIIRDLDGNLLLFAGPAE